MAIQEQQMASPLSRAVTSARELERALRDTEELVVTRRDALLQRSLTATGGCAHLSRLLTQISDAVAAGHRCQAQIGGERGFQVTWQTGEEADITGTSEVLLDESFRPRLDRFIASGNVARALEIVQEHPFELHVNLGFRSAGLAWLPSLETLVEGLASDSWLTMACQLQSCALNDRATFVVDGLDAAISTSNFTFVGAPEAARSSAHRPAQAGGAANYLAARRERGWPKAPSPPAFLPLESPAEPIDDSTVRLSGALLAVSDLLVWVWLASDPPKFGTGSVLVQFLGVRNMEVAVTARGSLLPGEARDAINLFQWATAAGDDPLRSDAVQRAVTLAVSAENDFRTAAIPVLRTARTLHELATRGAVAEALSARRAAREAAANAARGAANAAREAAAKATERSLALTVTAAATVFATVQKVLAWQVSAPGLLVLALLLCGSLLVALQIDFKGSDRSLQAFVSDLDQYRESMSESDISEIKKLAVLQNAHADVGRSRNAALIVYSVSTSLTVVCAMVLLLVRPS